VNQFTPQWDPHYYTEQGPYSAPREPAPRPPKRGLSKRAKVFISLWALFGLTIFGLGMSRSNDKASLTDPSGQSVIPNVVTTTEAPKAGPSAVPTTAPPATRKPVEQAPKMACADQEDRNAPCTVTAGAPFALGSHTVLKGWKVVDAGYGMSVTGKARNTSGKVSSLFIDIKFLRGDEVIADVMCSSGSLEPGQVTTMNCLGDGEYTKAYDRITAEATF
jgi:hypothetical protein